MFTYVWVYQNIFRKVYGQNNLNMNISICGQQPWGNFGFVWKLRPPMGVKQLSSNLTTFAGKSLECQYAWLIFFYIGCSWGCSTRTKHFFLRIFWLRESTSQAVESSHYIKMSYGRSLYNKINRPKIVKFFSELFGPVVNYGKKQNIHLQNFVLVEHPNCSATTPSLTASRQSVPALVFVDETSWCMDYMTPS